MFEEFDFALLDGEDFKEDSVRELIIVPLLYALGFEGKNAKTNLNVKRSVSVHSDTVTGSNETIRQNALSIPDYLLFVDGKAHCVLDAKAPKVKIHAQSKAERQAFYYAINKEIKAPFYALCNGHSFNLFQTSNQELLLELDLQKDLNAEFPLFCQMLTTPVESLRQIPNSDKKAPEQSPEWYLNRKIPEAILKPKKQAKKRHYGCTMYFTRQSWDIVTSNIKAFTAKGDVVLDSFGGSGVTAIEAMMNGRIGIHTDLNPLSVFMVKALSAKVNLGDLWELSEKILAEFETIKPKNEKEAKKLLNTAKYYPNAMDKEFGETATLKKQNEVLWIPKDEILPKGSDVPSVLGLFTPTQLAELALLRQLIFKHTTPSGTAEQRIIKRNLRYSFMLGFYNAIIRCNLTFHRATSQPNGGDSGVFRYYRYRIAPRPEFLDIATHFRQKMKRVLFGKQELENENGGEFYESYFAPIRRVIKDFSGAMISGRANLDQTDSVLEKTNGEKIFQADATNLKEIESESVDFIYTDPPYGAKIPYLDLSTMWNAWLDLPVDNDLKEKECIEKGSMEKTQYDYEDLMKKSLKEIYRVLKFNRWLAFVFQHQDARLFQLIVDSAENVGFEYAGVTSQEDAGRTSFKKVQNPTRVLKGQLVLYFKKVDNVKARVKIATGTESLEQMFKDVEQIIVKHNGASLETIHANLVKMAIVGSYYELMAQFSNVILLINERFDFDKKSGLYRIRESAKIFNYDIPIEERAKYYILGELTKAAKEGKGVNFDHLCLFIIPLLKNGVQANNKLVREILSEIAIENKTTNEWRLKPENPTFFDDI